MLFVSFSIASFLAYSLSLILTCFLTFLICPVLTANSVALSAPRRCFSCAITAVRNSLISAFIF
ncbi:hypothetical protein [Spiroplasma citri]|uniref:hypothetical protein n=2 Tax=Spiroplasma citri TaxID=2133 RepID=UPI0011BBA39F|nr:hypothetical protein [Spiroplasma citri]QED24650.1 hypothetical protein FRX96_04205 [Spiroplasma citri]